MRALPYRTRAVEVEAVHVDLDATDLRQQFRRDDQATDRAAFLADRLRDWGVVVDEKEADDPEEWLFLIADKDQDGDAVGVSDGDYIVKHRFGDFSVWPAGDFEERFEEV